MDTETCFVMDIMFHVWVTDTFLWSIDQIQCGRCGYGHDVWCFSSLALVSLTHTFQVYFNSTGLVRETHILISRIGDSLVIHLHFCRTGNINDNTLYWPFISILRIITLTEIACYFSFSPLLWRTLLQGGSAKWRDFLLIHTWVLPRKICPLVTFSWMRLILGRRPLMSCWWKGYNEDVTVILCLLMIYW